MVLKKKRRRIVEDDEPEQAPSRNGGITYLAAIDIDAVPAARAPGQRNPEYEKLVLDIIRLAKRGKAQPIAVRSKKEKVKIREGVRKPLRARGYDLTAITTYDADGGEILILYATKKQVAEPEDEEEETAAVEVEDEEDEEEEEEPAPKRKKIRR